LKHRMNDELWHITGQSQARRSPYRFPIADSRQRLLRVKKRPSAYPRGSGSLTGHDLALAEPNYLPRSGHS
jgi:hypothetical protein